MFFSLVVLIFFVANSSICTGTRYNSLEEGGNWQYGDIRWFAVSEGFQSMLKPPKKDCKKYMKPDSNWREEEHSDTKQGGTYHNDPRYYIRNRRASTTPRDQYIASRYPVTLDPVDGDEDQDTLKDIMGKPQIADIFCLDSKMSSVRIGNFLNTPAKNRQIVRDCGVIETLVKLCMTDPKVTPGDNGSKDQMIREAFEAKIGNINIAERDAIKTLVETKCEKLFRLENIGRKGFRELPGNSKKGQWAEVFNRYLIGAKFAGFTDLLVLDNELVWKIFEIDVLLEKVDGEYGMAQFFDHPTYRWPHNLDKDKEHWYFCYRKANLD